MTPDERSFRRHLDAGPFQAGVTRGDWRVGWIEWPNALIVVRAAPRTAAPDELALLFELSGYPVTLPTARPWDEEANAPLPVDLWPQGERASLAFNPNWNIAALYIPCDRLAYAGHEASWDSQYPSYLWDPDRGIVRYLETVREILHSSGYSGVQRIAA